MNAVLTFAWKCRSGALKAWPTTLEYSSLPRYGGRHQKSWTPRLLAKDSDSDPLTKLGLSSESRVRACPGLLVPTSVVGSGFSAAVGVLSGALSGGFSGGHFIKYC